MADLNEVARARLEAWIDKARLTQVEAAKLIGMHETQLSHLLRGHRRPGLVIAAKIATATGIPIEAWLPTDDDTPAEPEPASAGNRKRGKA